MAAQRAPSLQRVLLTQGAAPPQQRERTWTALLCAYQKPNQQTSTVTVENEITFEGVI